MFTHLVGDKAGDLNDLLTHGGFRRSQSIAYRPACDQCRACVSVRVIANEFRPSHATFARLWPVTPTSSANSAARCRPRSSIRYSAPISTSAIAMAAWPTLTVLDYAMMVEDSHVETRIIEYRRRGIDSGITGRGLDLVAVALTDVLRDGVSMVYSFSNRRRKSRSLGTFMILRSHRRARRGGLHYTSISATGSKARRKVDYKGRFLPQRRQNPRAGCASMRQAKCRPSRRIEGMPHPEEPRSSASRRRMAQDFHGSRHARDARILTMRSGSSHPH